MSLSDTEAELAELGRRFREHQRGRRPGVLATYVRDAVARLETRTFAELVSELEFQALRRNLLGPQASPIEKVNREFETVVYHDRRGRHLASFKRLRNIARLRNPA